MKTRFNKIVKTAAVGIFFMALLMNVKVSLTDPFVSLSNDALAQTSSSSSSTTYCFDCLNSNETCFTVNGSPGAKGTMKSRPQPCD